MQEEVSENSSIGLFEASDLDKDGKVTEQEAFNNINKTYVWKWTHVIDNIPKDSKEKFLAKFENEGISRQDFHHCIVTKLDCMNEQI